jgi:uncharacterized protein (DUF488 family)
MIYTIGYAALTPAQILAIADAVGAAKIVDCRLKPVSRKPGFHRTSLERALGDRYEWREELGGGAVKAYALRALCERKDTLLLMCLETAPGDCHRHQDIGVPLAGVGVEVRHIFEDQIVTATELQRSLEAGDDDEYEFDHFDLAAVSSACSARPS